MWNEAIHGYNYPRNTAELRNKNVKTLGVNMRCPACNSIDLRVDIIERNVASGYFGDGDISIDNEQFDGIWFTKWSYFFCYGCSLEENIKYLKGKLPYPIKDARGGKNVKVKRVPYRDDRGVQGAKRKSGGSSTGEEEGVD